MSFFPSLERKPGYITPNPQDDYPEGDDPLRHVKDNGDVELRFKDRSMLVGNDQGEQEPEDKGIYEHDANLAEFLPEYELRQIGLSLKRLIEDDIESQRPHIEATAKFIGNLGIDLSAQLSKDEMPFKGASSVYSMASFETILEMVAMVSTELLKPSGMVETVVMGESSDELQDVAVREKEWFNNYFDVVEKGFRKEFRRTIEWAFAAGSIYKKVYICPVLKRPTSLYIPLEDFIVNREHSSHFSSTRKTHILRLSENEYKKRVEMGMYADIDIFKTADSNDDNPIRETLQSIEGWDPSSRSGQDRRGYTLYESHVDYYVKGDPANGNYNIALPYRITVDSKSGNVIGLYRNWAEEDQLKERIEYFVNYSCFTSFSGEGYGLVHSAGKSAEAATSITRLIMNTALYANYPGGFYQSTTRLDNNVIRPGPGEWKGLPATGQPISNSLMAFPYKEPSPALQALKDQMEDNIRKPSAIISQKLMEAAPSSSSSAMAMMLENMHKVPNALIQNMHESFMRELELYQARFAEWLPAGLDVPFRVAGREYVIRKEDFKANVRVVPGSDPTTKNSTYRMILSEIILEKTAQFGDLINRKVALQYYFKNLGVSNEDMEKLLSPPNADVEPPKPMDPVTTIMALAQGQPVDAAVWQQHDAYIALLDSWMQNNPQSPHIPAAVALKEKHEAFKYMLDAYAQLGMQPPEDPSQLPPEQQNEIAIALAQLKMEQDRQQAENQPQMEPPLDPAKVELEAVYANKEIAQEKHALDARRIDIDEQKVQVELKKIEMEHALQEQEFLLKGKIEELENKRSEEKAHLERIKVENEQAMRERDQAIKERDLLLREQDHASRRVGEQ